MHGIKRHIIIFWASCAIRRTKNTAAGEAEPRERQEADVSR